MVQQPPRPPGGFQPPPPPPGMPGMPPQRPVRPSISIDTSALPLYDIIMAGLQVLFWIFLSIGWYKFEWAVPYLGGGSESIGGTHSAMGVLALIISILIFSYAGLVIANHYLSFLPWEMPVGKIYLGATGAMTFFTLLGLVVKGGGGVKISWGIFVGIVLAAVSVVISFLKMQQEG